MSLLQSRFKRSVKGRTGILDQTTNLLEGIVETSYNLSKETLVVVSRWPYFSKFASTLWKTFFFVCQKLIKNIFSFPDMDT